LVWSFLIVVGVASDRLAAEKPVVVQVPVATLVDADTILVAVPLSTKQPAAHWKVGLVPPVVHVAPVVLRVSEFR
jgi:hypothetical protein